MKIAWLQLDAIRRKLGKDRRAHEDQIQRYARTGERPTDQLTDAYVALTESALAAMDSSIGGADHQVACEAYSRALEGWQRTLKEAGV